jgi:hypothetical protein
MLTDVVPVELWATRQRRPSAAANPQGLAARVPLAQSDPWLEPIVDCSFDTCRTSHSVAASERLHHNPSFLRSSGSGDDLGAFERMGSNLAPHPFVHPQTYRLVQIALIAFEHNSLHDLGLRGQIGLDLAFCRRWCRCPRSRDLPRRWIRTLSSSLFTMGSERTNPHQGAPSRHIIGASSLLRLW